MSYDWYLNQQPNGRVVSPMPNGNDQGAPMNGSFPQPPPYQYQTQPSQPQPQQLQPPPQPGYQGYQSYQGFQPQPPGFQGFQGYQPQGNYQSPPPFQGYAQPLLSPNPTANIPQVNIQPPLQYDTTGAQLQYENTGQFLVGRQRVQSMLAAPSPNPQPAHPLQPTPTGLRPVPPVPPARPHLQLLPLPPPSPQRLQLVLMPAPVQSPQLDVTPALNANDLSMHEARTYTRWYSNILTKAALQHTDIQAKTMPTVSEVWGFLHNFRISKAIRDHVLGLFAQHQNGLSMGQFYAMLRLIGHCVLKNESAQALDVAQIWQQAPVPTPVGILATAGKKRRADEETVEAAPALDLDSFQQFLLTGVKPKQKKSKQVQFVENLVALENGQPTTAVIPLAGDYAIPMDQMMHGYPGGVMEPPPAIQEPESDRQEDSGSPLMVDTKPLRPNVTGPNDMMNMGVDFHALQQNPAAQPNLWFGGAPLFPQTGAPAAQPSQPESQQISPEPVAAMETAPVPLRPNRTGPQDIMSMGVDYEALRRLQDVQQPSIFPSTGLGGGNQGMAFLQSISGGVGSGSNSPLPRPVLPLVGALGKPPPPAPPPRRRGTSLSTQVAPPLGMTESTNSSTAELLTDLEQLKLDLERMKQMSQD